MDSTAEDRFTVEEPRGGDFELFHRHSFDAVAKWLGGAQLKPDVERCEVLIALLVRGQTGHEASVMSGLVRSAGLLPFRNNSHLEVLIAHPGGPWFARKDLGAWSLVKGLVKPDEDDMAAARREFEEETGWTTPPGTWVPLGETKLKSRKIVVAWAIEADLDLETFDPGTFTMNGREYPEVDRVEWMAPDLARRKLNPAQVVFVDRLEKHLDLNWP